MSRRFGKKNDTRKKFSRDAKTYAERADIGGSKFDSYLKEGVTLYVAKDKNVLRVLPPYWSEDPTAYYSIPVYIHYNVGPDKTSIACLQQTFDEPCPICEEMEKAKREGDTEYAKQLRPSMKFLAYVIDRKEPDKGVLLYGMPITLEKNLATQAVDPVTRAVINIDDLEEGYDISFNKTGKGMKTLYDGITIARRSSALSGNDEETTEWLDYVEKNPLPDVIQKYTYEYLQGIFDATPIQKKEEPTENKEPDKSLDPVNLNSEVPVSGPMYKEAEILAFDEDALVDFVQEFVLFTDSQEDQLAEAPLEEYAQAVLKEAKNRGLVKEEKKRTGRRGRSSSTEAKREEIRGRFRK